MEFWIKGKNVWGEQGILMNGGRNRILSVVKNKNGFLFMEECDGEFAEVFTKEKALKMIDELREWLNAT